MENMLYYVLLPLTLFAAVVTSQSSSQACINAQNALAADEACLNSILQLVYYTNGLNVTLTREDLDTYCSSTCRELNLQASANCDDEADNQMIGCAAVELVCSVNGDKSCIELLRSPQLNAVNDALEPARECNSFETDGLCSAGCAEIVEDFITYDECCAKELIEFERIYGNLGVSYDQILTSCNIDPPQFAPCEVINGDVELDICNGAEGLNTVTYGTLLLVAVINLVIF